MKRQRLFRHRRRGTTLMWLLVLMTVLLTVAGLLVRDLVAGQQERRLVERRQQAAFLVESGLERAAAQWRRSQEYRGETWRIAAEESGLDEDAVVTIEIVPAEEDQGPRVMVEAQYGASDLDRSTVVKELPLPVNR